jgi:hypothetical protein
MVFYYKCLRLLLYPQISKKQVNPRFLKACADSCAGVCGTYKRLHQSMAVGYSMMALQTVFMAGTCKEIHITNSFANKFRSHACLLLLDLSR